MQNGNIDRAIAEAKRFLERAKDYRDAIKEPDSAYVDQHGMVRKTYPSAPKESGALRRASLDLTRALAAMRRHNS